MKNLILLVVVLFASTSSFAQVADPQSLAMVNAILKDCPKEFSAATSNMTILNVTEEDSKNANGKTIHTYTLSTGYFASPIGAPEVVSFKVKLVRTPKDIQPADGYLYDKSCELQSM